MVLVRVLETRYDYPPIEGTDRPRYAAVGDLIHVTEEQAGDLVSEGRVEKMPSVDVGIKVSTKDLLDTMARMSPAISDLVKLMRDSDYTQRRNRANLAAHIAYTKRKVSTK